MASLTSRKIRAKDHVFFETKPWRTVAEIEHCRQEWKLYFEQTKRPLKSIEDVRQFIDCFNHRQLLPKREGRNNPRVGNIPSKVFKIWFARAYANGAYGLPVKSDKKRPSYTDLDKFFARRGIKGMRAALSNYRDKVVDPPNHVIRTPDLENLVGELKKLFPTFQTDKVFREDVVDQKQIDKDVADRLELAQLMRAAQSSSRIREEDVSTSPTSVTVEDIDMLLDRSPE